MSTGIVATLGANSSVSYTPTTNAKVRVVSSVGTSGIVWVNGVTAIGGSSAQPMGTFDVFVAGSSTITISTNTNCSCIISALES